MESNNKKPFKVKDITRNIKKAVVAGSLEEIRSKVAEKFDRVVEIPTIHLDSDGTEIDDEEYFRTLEANTELVAVFPGEHWIDPSRYVTVTNHPQDQLDASDKAAKTARIKQLMGQIQNNLYNVSVLSEPDLETLSNMDPNSLVDITGKDFMEQLKDSGRPLCATRNAQDRINLLNLLKDGAIFCSERYPEDAEAIDMEIRRQLKYETTNTRTIITTPTATTVTNNTPITETNNTKTIDLVQNNHNTQKQQQQQIVNISNINSEQVRIVVEDTSKIKTTTKTISTSTVTEAQLTAITVTPATTATGNTKIYDDV